MSPGVLRLVDLSHLRVEVPEIEIGGGLLRVAAVRLLLLADQGLELLRRLLLLAEDRRPERERRGLREARAPVVRIGLQRAVELLVGERRPLPALRTIGDGEQLLQVEVGER